tara:strand:- start:582 stop:971 length:390 start_codon:yes stop_codon:yes gene_type:complete
MKEILKKSTKNLIIWTLAWTGTLAILTFASNQLWDSLILTKIAFVINFAVGIGMIIANKNLINNFDELQRKIHMEAMAITLGLAVVVGISYEISFDFNIINSEPEGEYLIMFIGITYIISVLINNRKYI